MGIIDRFENAVERGMNTVFSRVFRSGLKPVDISSAIRQTMDHEAETSTKTNATFAPNSFRVEVSQSDFNALQAEDPKALSDGLASEATRYAKSQQYILAGPVEVQFVPSTEEGKGMVSVTASAKRGGAVPATASAPSPSHPIIDVAGEKWLLTEEVTVLGRSSQADIQVNDAGVSRKHVEFRITPDGVILTDLGSTNGTFVEGHRVQAATLLDGNQITIGRTRILFWTHPED